MTLDLVKARRTAASGVVSGAVAVGALLAASGCAIPTRVAAVSPEIPEKLTPVAVDAGLAALDRAETKRRIEHMLASPEMRAVQKELIAGMVDGSLAALSEKDRAERVGALSSRYIAGMITGLAREGGPEIGSAASAAMRGALSEANKREIARFVASVVDASVQPIAKRLSEVDISSTVSKAATEQLGPAIEQVLVSNVGPGIAGAMEDGRIQHALGGAANVMGREMVLGANEALKQMQASSPPEQRSVLERVGVLANKGANLATWATWMLVMVVVALGAWIAKLLMNTRRYRAELEEHEARTRLLDEAMRASKGKAWSDELRSALEERFKSEKGPLLALGAARGSSRPRHAGRATGHLKRRRRHV